MRKALLIVILSIGILCRLTAQEKFKVHGSVRDSTGIGLAKATVQITAANDTLKTLTTDKGFFTFWIRSPGTYGLIATMKGYSPHIDTIVVTATQSVMELKPIELQINYDELEPVNIFGIRPVTVGTDTITYHAAAFHVRDGAEVQAILKLLPGVEVDKAGNVVVQGKIVSKAMVDGKLFFGGDVLTAIQNLPADIVDKLQLIDDYGDKSRLTGVKSGPSLKVLNIVLKQDKRHGQFGNVQTGSGTKEKYKIDLFGNSFSGDRQISLNTGAEDSDPAGRRIKKNIGVSYADRWNAKWNGDLNTNVSTDKAQTANTVEQQDYFGNGYTVIGQSNQVNSVNSSGNFGNTLTLKPDDFHTLRISPTINFQRSKEISASDFSTLQNNNGAIRMDSGNSRIQTNINNYSVGSQLYFEQLSRHSTRRYSVQLDTRYSDNRIVTDDLIHTKTVLNNQQYISRQHYFINGADPLVDLGLSFNYFTPVGKTGFLELGYTWHDNLNKSDKVTRQQDSLQQESILIDSLGNHYVYHTMEQRLHTGFTANIHNIALTLGVDAQPGNMSGVTAKKTANINYPYFNWLPVLQATYPISKGKTISLSYNGNPSLPSLQQIQPYTDLTNPQYPVVGNPRLRPAYNQNISLQYEHSCIKATGFWGFGLNINYNLVQNTILQNIIHPLDSSGIIQTVTCLNGGNVHSLSSGYHLTLPNMIRNHLRITLGGQLTNLMSITMTDNVVYPMSTFNWNQSLHLQYNVPDIIETDLSCVYNSSHSSYLAGLAPATSFSGASWSINNRHYFARRWILNYEYAQTFTDLISHGLKANPGIMVASLQCQFLPKNRGTIGFVANDLLNTTGGVTQSFSPSRVTKTQTILSGRSFTIQTLIKFERFNQR